MRFHRGSHTFVEQVKLKVMDLERSLAFYQQVVGFRVLDRTERTASLTADGHTALLFIKQPEDVALLQGRTTGLYHFALLLPTRSDLAQMVRQLAASGIQIGSADHLVSEALYFSDPDGNGIEIYRDRDPSEWTWRNGIVQMTTDPLDFRDLLSSEPPREWDGLPAGTLMGHIHLHVSELRKTEEFYVKGLGFNVISRFGSQALFISTANYHHHIGLNTWNGVGAPKPPANSVGLRSFTLVFPDDAARNQAVAALQEIGASVENERGIWMTEDPSGNRIQLERA